MGIEQGGSDEGVPEHLQPPVGDAPLIPDTGRHDYTPPADPLPAADLLPVGPASTGYENSGVIADPELAALVVQGGEALGYDRLNRLLRLNEPFNQPHTTVAPDGTETTDPHYGHKHFLPRAIAYAQTCERVGMTDEEGALLLESALLAGDSARVAGSNRVTGSLAAALRPTAERGEHLTEEDTDGLLIVMAATSRHRMLMPSLHMIAAANRAGLGVAGASELIAQFMPGGTRREVELITEAMNVLDIADANPELIGHVFSGLINSQAHERYKGYELVKDALAYGGPAAGLTSNQILERIAEARSQGLSYPAAVNHATGGFDKDALTDPERAAVLPHTPPEQYFINRNDSPLAHAVLPYRTVRSFEAGIQDIHRLTFARGDLDERVAAGGWIFDPATSTWYSLGGETRQTGEHSIETTQLPYDVSRLSNNPLFISIHPAEYAPAQPERPGHMVPSPKELHRLAGMCEQAGSARAVRAFISHHRGITEIIHYPDAGVIRDLADDIEDVVQTAYGVVFGSWYMGRTMGPEIGEKETARRMFIAINAALDGAAELKLHPHGAAFSPMPSPRFFRPS